MARWLTRPVPLFWVVAAATLALVASIGWWLELRPAAAEWGTVSSWVATIGGLIAVSFAGSQLRLVLKQRRQAMGEAVAVVVERPKSRATPTLVVTLTNAGQFVVHHVRVQAVERAGAEWRAVSPAKEPPGGVLAPGIPIALYPPLEPAHAERQPDDLGVFVSFVDVEGHEWDSTHTLSGRKQRHE